VKRLLLDEHIHPAVAGALRRLCPGLDVVHVCDWHEGAFAGVDDPLILEQLHEEQRVLVSFDRRTILGWITRRIEAGLGFAGVILVDAGTIRPNDVGGSARALARLYASEAGAEGVFAEESCIASAFLFPTVSRGLTAVHTTPAWPGGNGKWPGQGLITEWRGPPVLGRGRPGKQRALKKPGFWELGTLPPPPTGPSAALSGQLRPAVFSHFPIGRRVWLC